MYMYMYIPVLSQLVHEYIVELHWKPCNGNVYIYLAVTVVPLCAHLIYRPIGVYKRHTSKAS